MTRLPRRHFLLRTSLAAAAAHFSSKPGEATAHPAGPTPTEAPALIDVNVHLSKWPFRSLDGDDTPALAARMQARGVRQVWAGNFDAVLHRDMGAVNRRTFDECKRHGSALLLPVGSIHPKLPDWKEDLHRCAGEFGMKIVRIYPGYHGYALDDPLFTELLALATSRNLLVQIVAQLEDARTHHPLIQVAPVNLKPLVAAIQAISTPKPRVMVLNASAAMVLTALRGAESVWLDVAMIEGVGGVENLLKSWPADRVCLGSHAPFFYWESARLKLQESGLTGHEFDAVAHQNATRALTPV